MEQDKNAELLAQITEWFEQSAKSGQYREWAKNAVRDYAFYNGRQLTLQEREELEENGQPVTVVNRIRPRIDNISGEDVLSRTKLVFRSRSLKPEQSLAAEAITDMAYYVQDYNNSSHHLSQVFRDSAVCGLGYIEADGDADEGITIAAHDPFEFVYDVSDTTIGMTEQNRVFRQHWRDVETAVSAYPEYEEEIRNLVNRQAPQKEFKAMEEAGFEYDDSDSDYSRRFFTGYYYDPKIDQVLIIECSYRKWEPMYEVVTKDGRVITTFDKDESEKLSASPKKDNVTEKHGWRVYEAFFTDGILLYHGPKEVQTGYLRYMPFPWMRDRVTHVPTGLVYHAIDSQRNYNKRTSKLIWYLNARQIVMDSDAVDSINELTLMAARPDGIIKKKSGSELRIEKHETAISQHLQVLQQADADIQASMGIYDESLGISTNAKSGIAIERRQKGSVKNQTPYFDKFASFKKSFGRALLALMQSVFTEEVVFAVTDDDGLTRAVKLNSPVLNSDGEPVKDKDGKPILVNDINFGRYDVFIDEVPDFSTALDDARERIMHLMGNGVQPSPGMLEFFGVPKGSKLYQEFLAGEGSTATPPGEQSASPAQAGAAGAAGEPGPVQ